MDVTRILFVFPFIIGETVGLQNSPPEGFKFNCGADICDFPIQYCDTAVGNCRYCNEDVCRLKEDERPVQCNTKCTVNGTTSSLRIEQQKLLETNDNGKFGWMIATIVLAVVLIGVLIALIVAIKRFMSHKKTEYTPVSVDVEQVQLNPNGTSPPSTTSQKTQTDHTKCKCDVLREIDNKSVVTPTAPPIQAEPSNGPSDEATKVSLTTDGTRSIASSLRNIHANPEEVNGQSENFGESNILPQNMAPEQNTDSMNMISRVEHPVDDDTPQTPGYEILPRSIGITKQTNFKDNGSTNTNDETSTKTFEDSRVLKVVQLTTTQ